MLASATASVRGLPRVYWYLWAGQLINRVGGFVVPFLTIYLTQELKLPLARAAVVVSLYGAGGLLAGPVGGLLADRLGRRTTLIGALITSAAFMVALGFARDPATIGVLALLIGFTTDTYRPAVSAIVADLLPPEDRLRAYAHLYWASNLGFSIAPAVAGFLATRGYLILFLADAATTLAFAAVAWLKVPETLGRTGGARTPSGGGFHDVLTAFRDREFVALLAVNFALASVFLQFQVALPAAMTAHGASPADFGTTMALNGVLIVFLQPLALPWLARFRRSRVLAVAALLVGVGFGLNAVFTQPWQYRIGVAVWTLGEIAHAPTSSSMVADLAPTDARGRYQGAYFMTWALAGLVSPLVGGAGTQELGDRFWWFCLATATVVAAAQLGTARLRRQRLAALRGVPVESVKD